MYALVGAVAPPNLRQLKIVPDVRQPKSNKLTKKPSRFAISLVFSSNFHVAGIK